MTTDEARRRQAVGRVEAASARSWPRKTLDAWYEALRPYDPELVEAACQRSVATWQGTLIMPVGRVVEVAQAMAKNVTRDSVVSESGLRKWERDDLERYANTGHRGHLGEIEAVGSEAARRLAAEAVARRGGIVAGGEAA